MVIIIKDCPKMLRNICYDLVFVKYIDHRTELKVWVNGLPRVVCGVTEYTTTRDIVMALAQASRKTGRYRMLLCGTDDCDQSSAITRPDASQFIDVLHQQEVLQPEDHPITSLRRFALSSRPVRLILTHLTDEPPLTPQPKSRFRHKMADKRRHSINSKFYDFKEQSTDAYLLTIVEKQKQLIGEQEKNIDHLNKEINEFELTQSACDEIETLRREHGFTEMKLDDANKQMTLLMAAIDAERSQIDAKSTKEEEQMTDAQIKSEIAKLHDILTECLRRENEVKGELESADCEQSKLEAMFADKMASSNRALQEIGDLSDAKNKESSQKVLWV